MDTIFLRRDQKRKIDVKAIEQRVKSEDSLDLEKGDLPAIFIAAFAVFMPFVLGLSGVLVLMYWILVGRF